MENQEVLNGRLEEVRFPEVILQISKRKETGVLHIRRYQVEKDVFFQNGNVVFARSTDLDERLGEVLLRLGKVTCRQVDDSVKKISPGQRLGTVLVQEGYLSAPDLYHGVIRQVEEILYDLFDWSEGEYEFRAGSLPTQEVITLNISTADIIVKGMSRIWRSSWIMKGVGPLSDAVKRTDGWADAVKKLSIPQKVRPMLEMLNGPSRLEDFLQVSPLSNFETCKWLWAFSIIGVVQQIPSSPAKPLKSPPSQVVSVVPKIASLDPSFAQPASPSGKPQSANPGEASFSDVDMLTTNPMVGPPARPTSTAVMVEENDEIIRDREIRSLNEKQRFISERLRFEMGAGVGNFLSKILKKVCGKYPLLFEGVALNEFGELDAISLNHNIEGNMFENFREAFAYLQEEQKKVIASFFDKKTVEAIEAGLNRITEEQNRQSAKI